MLRKFTEDSRRERQLTEIKKTEKLKNRSRIDSSVEAIGLEGSVCYNNTVIDELMFIIMT